MPVCEQIQESMASPRFSVGPLAGKRERAIATFQSIVSEYIGTNAGDSQ